MRKNISEGRVLKSSQPTLDNMTRILVDILKAEGLDAEKSYKRANSPNSSNYIDVIEFKSFIELNLERGAKYKIIPNMKEIDFDLEGKGMEAFKADAEDLAKELASKLNEDRNLEESFNDTSDIKLTSIEQIEQCFDKGVTVFIDGIGPFGEGTATVIDTRISTDSVELDAYTLSDMDYSDEYEFFENEDGSPAIVIDDCWGQTGCNFRILDACSVEDFDIYVKRDSLKKAGLYFSK